MSNNDGRKKLYAEYRAAMRERDDKKAYTILKKITEADPNDSTARMQCEAIAKKVIENTLASLGTMSDLTEVKRRLSELETLFSASQLNKYPDYAKAWERAAKAKVPPPQKDERLMELRRSLRDALISREREKAFDLLEEICEIAPTDQDAQRQKKETGKLLCRQYASEMQRLTHSGNMPELSSLIDRMRRWASAPILEQMEGYKAAEELVSQYRRHEVEKEITQRLAVLRSNKDLSTKERYGEVREVEKRAEKHGIVLRGEDAAFVRSVKKAWDDEENARKRKRILAELGIQYRDIQNSLEPITDASDQILLEKLPLLDEILRQATALGDYPEVEEFADPILHKMTRIRQLLKLRRSMRRFRILVRGAALALTICLLVLGAYAWTNADSTLKEMEKIRDGIKSTRYTPDEMVKLRILTSSTPFGYGLTRLFRADHQVIFGECTKFVRRFDDLRGDLARVTEQMRCLTASLDFSNPDASKIREYAPLMRTADSLEEALKQEYHYELSSEERQIMCYYKKNVVNEMKSRFFNRYSTPPLTATLEELEKLWLEYKDINTIFKFDEEEGKVIHEAFMNAFRQILLCEGKSESTITDLRSSMELFDKYRESMELDESLRDEITVLLKKLEEFENIDTKLSEALSFDEYLYSVIGFGASYFDIPDLYDYRPIEEWYTGDPEGGKLRDLAVKTKASSLHALPRQRECNRELYEKIKRIFEDERGIYLEYRESVIGAAVARLTKDTEQEKGVWKKSLQVAIDGEVVYPGAISKINGETLIHLLDACGNEIKGKIHRSRTAHGERYLRYADMRERIGFVDKKMLRGTNLPIDLLHRTAMERKNAAYPVMALAWLFNETINLMETFPEPLVNGIAFSPSLKKDIAKFKELAGHMDIRKGCWLLPHMSRHEDMLISFFAKCESTNYRTEILRNLNAILNAELLYAGYVGENGRRVLLGTARGMRLYHIVWNQKNEPRLDPVTENTKLQRFTPVFVLK